MKTTLSERNIVVVLFIMVLVTFAFEQEDTKKKEKGFTAVKAFSSPSVLAEQKETPKQQPAKPIE
jgi:hypothetical protein